MRLMFLAGLLAVMAAASGGGAGMARAAGFVEVAIADGDAAAIVAGVWYPSDALAQPTRLRAYEQNVAPGGAIRGQGLPLILLSHGSGGWYGGHWDTAVALAETGFVVVAPNHAGDTSGDMSARGTPGQFTGRVRQMSVVLRWALETWSEHGRLDAARVGAFGFSAGGFTALTAGGGRADLSTVAGHCAAHADAFCQGGRPAEWLASPPVTWPAMPQVRAVVAAAPGMGFAFAGGLGAMQGPVQLWTGTQDEELTAPYHAAAIAAALPAAEFRVVQGAGHFAFMAPCTPALREIAPEICHDPAEFDRVAFKAGFNREVVAFFARALR